MILRWWRARRAEKRWREYVEGIPCWTDDTGQTLMFVHSPEDCEGRGCPIHHPSDHHMVDWPRHFRFDRHLMERICTCGVGHPDPDDVAYQYSLGARQSISVHGCCGCCRPQVPGWAGAEGRERAR